MRNKPAAPRFIQMAAFAGIMIAACDLPFNGYLGLITPGYDWVIQSESALAEMNPVAAQWQAIWGVIFTLAFATYALGLWKAARVWGKPIRWVAVVVLIYGIGQGIGSGWMPLQHSGAQLTVQGVLHETFGGIGMLGLFIAPVIMLPVFTKKANPRRQRFTLIIVIISTVAAVLYLVTRVAGPEVVFWGWRGLWQRCLNASLYSWLIALAYWLLKDMRSVKEISTSAARPLPE